MKYRNFCGLPISDIGLGTWQLGSSDWGEISEEKAFAILQAYVDNGGNFIDTADVYGGGNSERVIGNFLSQLNSEMFIATKFGRRSDNGFGWPKNFGIDTIRRQTEESLKNLQLNSIFLQQIHCIPFEILKEGKVFEALRKLQDEKLIQHWGVSVETEEEALFCLEQEGISSLQIIFNIFRQHYSESFFKKAYEKGVALIVRVPLASGILSGKFSENTTFENSDHRNYNSNGEHFNVGETFSGIEFSKAIGFANEIKTIFGTNYIAPLALRWILDFPEITTVIPGASSVIQVTKNISVSDMPPISTDCHKALSKLYKEKIRKEIRGAC